LCLDWNCLIYDFRNAKAWVILDSVIIRTQISNKLSCLIEILKLSINFCTYRLRVKEVIILDSSNYRWISKWLIMYAVGLAERSNETTQRFSGSDCLTLSVSCILPRVTYKTVSYIVLNFHYMFLKLNPFRSHSFVFL
jgi:hypothetical protein